MFTHCLGGVRDERSFYWVQRLKVWENSMDNILNHISPEGLLNNSIITQDFLRALFRQAIEDHAEDEGYDELESQADRRGGVLSETCKDNKTYYGRPEYDGSGGSGGGGYGLSGGSDRGWKSGKVMVGPGKQ